MWALILMVWGLPGCSFALVKVAPPPVVGVLLSGDLPLDTLGFYDRYPFIRFVGSQEDAGLVQLSDEEILDQAGKVVFRVNRYDVFTNDSLLHELETLILPRINRDSLRLCRIVVRGAASPEGPVPNNRMLGRRRVATLANFLRARMSVPVDERNFTTEAVTEDYRLLLTMMRRAADPDFDAVQRLCNRHLPRYEYTLLKRELQRLQGGRLWRRLLKDYFPELRAARVVLFFEEAKPQKETPETIETPEAPKTIEAVEVSETPELPLAPRVLSIPRRELLSVKTNLLLDFAYVPGYDRWCPIPNVAIEYYPLRGHFTYGASLDFPWWQHYSDHKFFQIRNYQLEARYYLRSGSIERRTPGEGAAFRGLYFSAYAHAALFGICFDADRGWEGEALGGGLGVGYVLPLGRKGHWRMEFSAQVGVFFSGYDPYQYENPVNPYYRDGLYYYKWTGRKADFRERQYRFTWFGPTRAGITISYDILYRRWRKKSERQLPASSIGTEGWRGASFRDHELVVEE